MIKRIRLVTSKHGLGPPSPGPPSPGPPSPGPPSPGPHSLESGEFARLWGDAAAAAAAAPEPARPVRLTVSVAVPEIVADQKYDGVGLEWFTDEEHLLRFETWLRTPDGQVSERLLGDAVDLGASPVVVSDERVARGADWLEQRWQDGKPKLKQLAIATRAAGLTLPQFLDRWRSRAGKIGAAPIPEAYRGLAYVQNHPRPTADQEWAYDAINEVYFDDAESLLARIAYFDRELTDTAESDLISANWFLAVREQLVEFPTK